ncbi:MAG: U32 family peptidase [Lachnospiraceae bacterium]|nr:U32 family peptidase [Lachnospiraceae bacterium]
MGMELLAPAGSIEGLKAVIAAGADAVYIGGTKFGARAFAKNPEEEELLEALDYAHLRGVRLYLTVNTLLKENEIQTLPAYLAPYVRAGLDAVLVQDLGVLKTIREAFPELPLHASTQMTVTGPLGAGLLKEFGVTRVVPARELSLKELARIRRESGLELEAFVHGALCYSYSGLCLFSSMLGGRSGNRGRCAQPCRLFYTSSEGGREKKGELLSLKDLRALHFLPELQKAGVSSLKIEGRMKQTEYAAGVVAIYRKYLDLLEKGGRFEVDPRDEEELGVLFSRTVFTGGYLVRRNGPEMVTKGSRSLSRGEEARRNELYARIRKQYVEKEKEIPLEGSVRVVSGEAIRLELKARGLMGEVSFCARGARAEAARKAPLEKERILEQIRKTGGTGFFFEALSCESRDAFVPMGSLNALRREALEGIREALLSPFRREAAGERAGGSLAPDTPVPEAASKRQMDPQTEVSAQKDWKLTAIVSSAEQLEEALHFPGVDTVTAEAALFMGREPLEEAKRFLAACRECGKKAEIALPYVEREGKTLLFAKNAGILKREGLAAFLVRNLESAAGLRSFGHPEMARADSSLYTMNGKAEEFLEELGFMGDTLPFELNRKEILRRDNKRSRVMVYGRIPLMISAQCLRKNQSACTGRPGFLALTDRKGFVMPVRCECAFCYNVIYNSQVLALFGEAAVLKRAGLRDAVLHFTDEDRQKTRECLELFEAAFRRGETVRLDGGYTKGHFNREVE